MSPTAQRWVRVTARGAGTGRRGEPPRAAYRRMAKAAREAREAERRDVSPEQEHAAREARLESVRSVAGRRVTEPFDWTARVAARGEYEPRPFEPPAPDLDEAALAAEAARRVPLWPWIIVVAGAVWLVLIIENPLLQLLAALPALAAAILVWRVPRRRAALRDRLLADRRAEHEARVEAARVEHEAEESRRKEQWEEEERRRQRLRETAGPGDPVPLAELLESELAKQELPVPVVMALELHEPGSARVEFALPEPMDVPRERSRVSDAGELLTERLPEQERAGLYANLCRGLALRLAWETVRVLPMLGAVEVTGTWPESARDGRSGREVPALQLKTTARELRRLDLDGLGPGEAFERLGGVFRLEADGEPRPFEAAPPAG